MKLCYVISNYDPKTSTHYYHLHEFIELLSKDIDIFFLAESGNPKVSIKGVNNHYVQRFKFLPLRLIERAIILLWIYARGYRRFYCHYADLTTIMAALLTRTFGGTTYKWHCVQEHHYQKPFSVKHWREKLFRELPLHISFALTQHLVTSSAAMKNYYIRNFHLDPNKILVIPNFINIKRFKLKHPPKSKLRAKLNLPHKPVLLYVHRLSERKGADRLIQIASVIKEKRLNQFILAIGKGPLLEPLKAQVKTLKLGQWIRFIGPVPNQQLTKYYHAADIFIMPSRIEEFARVQLEAMVSGLPIIATQTLASLSVLNKTQRSLVISQSKFQNIPLIADKLIKSKTRYAVMVKTGHIQVKKYDTELISKQFQNHIINS